MELKCCNVTNDDLNVNINSKELISRFTKKDLNITDSRIIQLISDYREAFQVIGGALGEVKNVEHRIDLTTDIPIKGRPIHLNNNDALFTEETVRHMESLGIIKKAYSPYGASTIVVKQLLHESQPLRFCIDYRKLNSITVPKPFFMPKIDHYRTSVRPELQTLYHHRFQECLLADKD